MAFGRPGQKAAAVKIEQHASGDGLGRAGPFAGDRAKLSGGEADFRGGRSEALEQGVKMRLELTATISRDAVAGRLCTAGSWEKPNGS